MKEVYQDRTVPARISSILHKFKIGIIIYRSHGTFFTQLRRYDMDIGTSGHQVDYKHKYYIQYKKQLFKKWSN